MHALAAGNTVKGASVDALEPLQVVVAGQPGFHVRQTDSNFHGCGAPEIKSGIMTQTWPPVPAWVYTYVNQRA